jgi:cell division septation protein DedD
MAKDYARKAARKPDRNRTAATPRKKAKPVRRPEPRQPARRSVARAQHGGLSLKWILSLAAIGGFVGFIAYLNSLPAPDQTGAPASAPEQAARGEDSAATGNSEKKPGFRFYDMLPDSEVVPPQVDEYTPGPGQTTSDYLVQTGSFRTKADAERQRAQIAFQGLRAYVSRIDMEGGSTWFRVNVGPFSSRSQMNSAVDKLVSINIEPLVRRIPRENSGEG